MRRVILAVTGTVAGLVALLSFKSHSPAIPAVTTSGTGMSSSPSSGGPQGSAGPAGQGFATGAVGAVPAGERAVTGQAASTAYGPVQIQLLMRSSTIVKVTILKQPSSTIHDLQLGQLAFPRLISETLTAQSARIDAVSGASYTSQGYIASLQSALDTRT